MNVLKTSTKLLLQAGELIRSKNELEKRNRDLAAVIVILIALVLLLQYYLS